MPSAVLIARSHRLRVHREIRSAGGPALPADHRFALVLQYADAERGLMYEIHTGRDASDLLQRAEVDRWAGWLPLEIVDLDTGKIAAVGIDFHVDRRFAR